MARLPRRRQILNPLVSVGFDSPRKKNMVLISYNKKVAFACLLNFVFFKKKKKKGEHSFPVVLILKNNVIRFKRERKKIRANSKRI